MLWNALRQRRTAAALVAARGLSARCALVLQPRPQPQPQQHTRAVRSSSSVYASSSSSPAPPPRLPQPPSSSSSAAAAAAASRVTGVRRENEKLLVKWNDGRVSVFHFVWLRDNCPALLDPSSFQKRFQSDAIPPSVHYGEHRVTVTPAGGLVVEWAYDGHRSEYTPEWLRRYDYSQASDPDAGHRLEDECLWDASLSHNVPRVPFDAVMGTEQGLFDWLRALHMYGLCVITDAPREPGLVDVVARRMSYVRNTIYAHPWDVVAKHEAENVAYTSVRLGAHHDLCYYEAPPGIQLLHVLRNDDEVVGGHQWFVDGFRVARDLHENNPAAYKTLCETYVTFHYRHGTNRLRFRRPTIDVRDGRVHALHVSPPFEGPLQVAPEQVVPYYNAKAVLYRMLDTPSMHVSFRPPPGGVITFNNRRVLHARDKYTERHAGQRHLQGTYVDLDEFYNRLRYMHELFTGEPLV